MNVFISGSFQKQAAEAHLELTPTLPEVTKMLAGVTPENLSRHPDIKRVEGLGEEIYVMRIRNLRLFLTLRNGNIVLMGIENR